MQQKTKEQKLAAALAGGKSKKKVRQFIFIDNFDMPSLQCVNLCYLLIIVSPPISVCVFTAEQKWNKGKMREKLNAKILFDEDTLTRFNTEVPKVSSHDVNVLEAFLCSVSMNVLILYCSTDEAYHPYWTY